MSRVGKSYRLLNQIKNNKLYFAKNQYFGDLRIDFFHEMDIDESYLSWLNNSEHMKYSDQQFEHHTRESSRNYLSSFEGTPNLFLKVLNNSQIMIGTLTIYIDVNHNVHNCGILIDPNLGGMGYGKSAWTALINEICPSLGARKIVAGTLENNSAMIKLFQYSNMNFEARLRSEKEFLGRSIDVLIYSRFVSR